MRIFLLVSAILVSAACGRESVNHRNPARPQIGDEDQRPNGPTDEDSVLVRAHWQLEVTSGAHETNAPLRLMLAGTDVPVSSNVPAAVRFEVDTDNFISPTPSEEISDFGTIDLTRLRDNELRQCGSGGNQKCQNAALRIFTNGDGPGLWNAVEQYGLPVLTGDQEIGYQAAGAFVLGTADLSSIRVLRLRHFSDDRPMQIPISVDFAEAAAGSYQTTLRLEYILY